MREEDLWTILGLGFDQPLTDSESMLLKQLELDGLRIAGLALQQRNDGRVYVASFEPADQSNERDGLTLKQLIRGGRFHSHEWQLPQAAGASRLALRLQAWRCGPEHPDTLALANNLANSLYKRGDLASALRINESVYGTCQRVLGAEHPDTLSSANNLAETLREQGDLDGARIIHESVYESRQRILGAEHPDTLASADNLGVTLMEQHDLGRARRIQESAYKIYQRVRGPEHPDTLIAANNLATTLRRLRDLAGARKIQVTAYETSLSVLGPEHPDTLVSANNLAFTLWALGDVAGARRIQESVYETHQRVLGPEHWQTANLACSLAHTCLQQGDLVESARVCTNALQTLAQASGADSVALQAVASLPMLLDPSLDWPGPAIASLPTLLAELSHSVRLRLQTLPADQAEPLYAALVALHERWCVFSWEHLPELERVDALLAILAPLHGAQAWTDLAHDTVQSAIESSSLASQAVRSFTAAIEDARYLREQMETALQVRRESNQAALTLQHRLTRIRQGEGEEAQAAAAADPQIAPRLQSEWGVRRQAAEAARLALEDLTAKSRAANAAVEQALHALAAGNPELHSMLQPPVPTASGIQATLADGELWLVQLPGRWIKPDLDFGKWAEQASNYPSCALVLRKDQLAQVVQMAPSAQLALLSDVCRGHVRRRQRGLLRDSEPGHALPARPELPTVPRAVLQQVIRGGFWAPLGPMLNGIDRIHMVSAAGSHDLMLELGRPGQHAAVVLHRYCGLPAYWRRIQARPGSARQALRYSWIHDQGWGSGQPILFTPLDSWFLQHHRLGQPQTALELLEHGPAADVLVISSHGLQGGDGSTRGGRLVVDGQSLALARVCRRRSTHDTPQAARSLRGLIALSCFSGVVGSTGHGDALGTIATLQALGLEWAIACLAPVADFYMPLFSAVLMHQLQQHEDPSLALESARRLVTQGPWDVALQQEVIEPLREAYRARMLELLREATDPAANEQHERRQLQILASIAGWSLTGPMRRAMSAELQQGQLDARALALRALLPHTPHSQAHFVDDCVEVLMRQPHQRDPQEPDEDGHVADALQHLAAVTVFFGRG